MTPRRRSADVSRTWVRRTCTTNADEDGRVADFHSLRHTYATAVVRAGATVKEAQTLARHGSPELTFRVYAHARLSELGRTLDAMPATPGFAKGKHGAMQVG